MCWCRPQCNAGSTNIIYYLHHEKQQYIFNLSLSLEKVSFLWKTSYVVLVPKTTIAKEQHYYRAVALTAHLMKTMVWVLCSHPVHIRLHIQHQQLSSPLSHCWWCLKGMSSSKAQSSWTLWTGGNTSRWRRWWLTNSRTGEHSGRIHWKLFRFKWLGVQINHKLDWTHDPEALY